MRSEMFLITQFCGFGLSSSQNLCLVAYRRNSTYLVSSFCLSVFLSFSLHPYYFLLCNPMPYYIPLKSGFEDEVTNFLFDIFVGLQYTTVFQCFRC